MGILLNMSSNEVWIFQAEMSTINGMLWDGGC